mgnify:FL=1
MAAGHKHKHGLRGGGPRSGLRWLWLVLAPVLVGPVGLLLLPAYVIHATRPYRYADPAAVPAQWVALVPGAGIINGEPTPALAERIYGAVELYRLGKVQKLLFSGDNSSIHYDEVTAMRRYAMSLGVPAEDITLDYAGFSTYETCYRARDIFGVRKVVIVTQSYHLPRAVYTARQLGIDAVGLGMPDWTSAQVRRTIHYTAGEMVFYTLREALAILKALWDVHVAHPLPTYLGPFEGID